MTVFSKKNNFPKRSFHILLTLAALLALPQVALAEEEEFLIGATTHFAGYKGDADENISVFSQAQLSSPRDDTQFERWDKVKGVYTPKDIYTKYLINAEKHQLSPIQIIAHNPPMFERIITPEQIESFTRFGETIVRENKGKTKYYQIFNEWDSAYGRNPQCSSEAYMRLLKVMYPRLKKIDPACVVLSTSICAGEKFLLECIKGGLLNYCDGVSFHSYAFRPSGIYQEGALDPEAYTKYIGRIAELIRKHNNGKYANLYLTETGWPMHSELYGYDEETVANYVARVFLLARTIPGVKGLWWYDFQDDGYDHRVFENNFGLTTCDLTPKSGLYVLRSIASVVRRGKMQKILKTPDSSVRVLQFAMPDGSDVLAVWTLSPNCRKQIIFNRGSAPAEPLKLLLAGQTEPMVRQWGFREWMNALHPHRWFGFAKKNSDLFSVSVTGRPMLIFGKLDGVRVAEVKTIPRPAVKTGNFASMIIPEQIVSSGSWISFSGDMNYRMMMESATKESRSIDARFRIDVAGEAMKVTVEVTDDKHVQNFPKHELWKGDSVQFAFAAFDSHRSMPRRGTEYTLALGSSGPTVNRESAQNNTKTPTQMKCDIRREGPKLIYQAVVPMAELGIEKGNVFGFSIIVNDNDGMGRKAYLHWGDGVYPAKNPLEYNWILQGR